MITPSYIKNLMKLKLINKYRSNAANLEEDLCCKESINVIFFAMNISMWKYDNLYNLMQKDNRFKPVIVSAMRMNESKEERILDQQKMKEYFLKVGYNFIEGYQVETDSWYDVSGINPTLIFYTQPYEKMVYRQYDYSKFPNSLISYVPYSFEVINAEWVYNQIFHNVAWKIFYPTKFQLELSKRFTLIKGQNGVVTGYPMADLFLDSERKVSNIWKISDPCVKRIIWAPHHSIIPKGLLDFSTFLSIAEDMLQLAIKYKDHLQFAFKPHPVLLTNLYKHSDWGVVKTDAYYAQWAKMPNTILADEEYVDLFLSSDAMIHDSASFSVEYHYTKKPVMYLTKKDHQISLNEFGKLAFDIHYKGTSIKDIESFIEEVVISGADPMRNEREQFFQEYLIPPNGKSASQNIIDEILKYVEK